MKKLKKSIILLFMALTLLIASSTMVSAGSRTTVYNKGDWKVYLDSPDGAKGYYHLHFYKKKKHIYCLRLDNFKYCDGKNGKDQVPNKVYEKVMAHSKVKSAVKSYHSGVEKSAVFKAVVKVASIGIGAILVVLAAFNVFTGPADDAVAWGFFLKALAS